jgi:hypothetical protein
MPVFNASRKNQAPGINSTRSRVKFFKSTLDKFFSTGEKYFSTGDNFFSRGDKSLISGRG